MHVITNASYLFLYIYIYLPQIQTQYKKLARKQTMAEIESKPQAIMISVPYQGHINPFVSLALKLASNGFAITFVHLEFVHHRLSKAHYSNSTTDRQQVDLFSEARETGLDIRYTTISDGLPLEFDRDLHLVEYWESMMRDFPPIVDEFVRRTIASDPFSAHFIVTDTNFWFSPTIANKYNLVCVSFWTEPALVFSLIYHTDLLREKGHFPCKDDMVEDVDYVAGVGKISTTDFMPYLKESESEGVVTRVLSLAFVEVRKADFILLNTVDELESETISALNKYQPSYAIGPITFHKNLPTNSVSRSLWSESDCTKWLESKSPGSVLYISFGSLVPTSKQVIEELAYGLLLSEVNFIWVIRPGIVGYDSGTSCLPDGFEDEVGDKGLIIAWCNQIEVLSNPAVGGFLTHNGWNSTVESMTCGVPMVCYPLDYDQPTNRKLVVDNWKIGINLCDGECVDRKEVAEKIKSLTSGLVSKSLRQEASNVKAIVQNAVETDGSSQRNFDQFIKDLRAKIRETSSNMNKN